MSENKNSAECKVVCWAAAAFVGFVSMILLYLMADFGILQAIFTGGLIGVVLGLILSLFICRGQTAAADLASDEKPAQRYAKQAAAETEQREGSTVERAGSSGSTDAAPAASTAPATSAAAATGTAAPLMASDVSQSKPAENAADEDKAETSGTAATAQKPEAKKTAAKKTTSDDANAKKEVAKKAAATSGATKAKRAPVAADGQPELYTTPPADGGDDLKLISGVGPKLEQTLNDLGIYRFEQVAGWRKKEIAWVDDRLRFKGRIERDDWMSQAKILAKGGETEFSKRKKK